MKKRFCACLAAAAVLCVATAVSVRASVVRFDTVVGSFYVQLHDETTPLNVANFLNYVNDGDYDESFIHRSLPGFVVQGGGFTWISDEHGLEPVATDDPVANEPIHSNVRGTIAMAKQAGDPDSATSQWFFNLADNNDPDDPNSLDNQNGGFTVFGYVIGDGMDVVDAIAALQRVNAGPPFDNLPVRDWDQASQIVGENLVIINTVALCRPGDIDCDDEVGLLDLDVLGNHYGSTSASWLEGDLNHDGTVGLLDLDILGRHWGDTAVPEPTALGVLVVAGVVVLRRGRG